MPLPADAEALPLSRRLALGAVAAAFPDADIVMSLGSPIAFMLNHRGLTHSLVVLPIWAWLLAWLASRLWRDPRGWRPYFAVTAMGVGIHIAGDLITSYGTMIFAPLSDARFALGTTFIIDLYFSGIILAGLAASRWWRASRTPAITACAALVAYVGFQAVLRHQAVEAGREYARAQHLDKAQVSALERPVSPFNWRIVVAQGDERRYADVNLLARTMPAPATDDAGLIARLSSAFAPVSMARWIRAPLFGSSPEDIAHRARSMAAGFVLVLPLVRRLSGAVPDRPRQSLDMRVVRRPALQRARAGQHAVPLRRVPRRRRALAAVPAHRRQQAPAPRLTQ